jgi:hypothetical protein
VRSIGHNCVRTNSVWAIVWRACSRMNHSIGHHRRFRSDKPAPKSLTADSVPANPRVCGFGRLGQFRRKRGASPARQPINLAQNRRQSESRRSSLACAA